MEQMDGICRLSNLYRTSLYSHRQMHNHQSTKRSDSICHSCRQSWDPRGSKLRGPVLLCQGPAGVEGKRCQAEGNQARRKLILFEVSQCQIKEIKDLFRVKQTEIKEAFFRFQSKPFVQFNSFPLVFFISHNRTSPPEETHPLALKSLKRSIPQQSRKHSFHSCTTTYTNMLLHTALSLEINP